MIDFWSANFFACEKENVISRSVEVMLKYAHRKHLYSFTIKLMNFWSANFFAGEKENVSSVEVMLKVCISNVLQKVHIYII